jgi:hypothetical protein
MVLISKVSGALSCALYRNPRHIIFAIAEYGPYNHTYIIPLATLCLLGVADQEQTQK